MKQKHFLLASTLMLFMMCNSANAQIKFGPKVGLVHSGMASKTEYKPNASVNDVNSKTAYISFGAVGEYWFGTPSADTNFSLIHAELKWTRRGGALISPSDKPNSLVDSESFRLDYLELPITYGYSVSFAQQARVVFRGGAYLSYGLNGKRLTQFGQTGVGSNEPFSAITHETATLDPISMSFPKYNRLDAGLVLGVDAFYNRFFISCDYQHAFTPLVNYNKSGNVLNRNFVFSVGCLF